MAKGYAELPNELVSAANGIEYAYRYTGGGEDAVPPSAASSPSKSR